MKSFKQMFILFLLVCCILSGVLYAQNNSDPNNKAVEDSSEPLISEKFVDKDLMIAIEIISSDANIPIFYEAAVEGKVTCDINNVPVSKALEIILSETPYKIVKMEGFYLINLSGKFEIKNTINSGIVLKKITISGKVGIAGVAMRGAPNSIVSSGSDGSYSITVPFGWSGKIIPQKEGFEFSPQYKEYLNSSSDFTNQDYKAAPIVCSISGSVGVEGVRMEGLPGNPVTDRNGSYSVQVSYSWSGVVKPKKEGYTFQPADMAYQNLTKDQVQDFYAEVNIYEITGNTGLEGVRMTGLPGNLVTGPDGSYSISVEYGFSGTVKPVKEGYTFSPASMIYKTVVSDKNNQDYKAAAIIYTISGTTGIEGVRMNGLPGDPVTDRNGSYSVMVEYGWIGTVTPEKRGYSFEPASRIYNNIVKNYNDENYVAKILKYQISGTIISDKGEAMEGIQIASENIIPVITDNKGRYAFEVEYGWSGLIRPESEQYTLTPPFVQYLPVNRNISNQNYKAQIRMLTITDTIKLNDKPIQNIKVDANPGNISTVTDSRSRYSIQVPYGWSGEIIFSKPGITIEPASKSYTNVTTDIINGIPVQPKTSVVATLQEASVEQARIDRTGDRRIIIVPDQGIKSEEIAQTKEDILVMAEILDERFREPRLIEGVLRDFGDFFGRDNQQTEAIYIQGYGVIFMIEVNYQFSSLSQPIEEVTTEPNNDIDQTWEQAKQRVFSPETDSTETKSSGREYEKQMVNILKTELIRTLKYASNIRNLQSDEWVIVSVSGTNRQPRLLIGSGYDGIYGSYDDSYGGGMMGGYGSSTMGGYGGGAPSPSEMRGGYGYGGGSNYGETRGGYGGGMMGGMMGGYGASSPAGMMGGYGNLRERFFPRSLAANIMTMRVKKSDVDEFANEKIDFEQFREKVQILIN